MDDQWERALAAALGAQTDSRSVRTLTLDGAVKCMHGQLPPPPILERFVHLQHLSLANIGAASLEFFPRLSNLQSLILSDNRIAGGLEYLVLAKLDSLRDLDLSNNRIQSIRDLSPLARLKLVSLDLYECPVTRENGYRSSVFGLIKSLKYLDKGDAEGNERPESEDEEEDDEDDEYDPGSGEIDGEDRPHINGGSVASEGVLDADEDEESDADEEVDLSRMANGLHDQINGGLAGNVVGKEEEYDEGDDDESVDEIDEEDDDEATRGANQGDSDDEDAVDEDDDEDYEEEEVDNEWENIERITHPQVGIDVSDSAEEVDLDCGYFEEEDEEGSEGYLVRPVMPQCNGGEEVDSEEEEVEDEVVRGEERGKRKRGEEEEEEDGEEEEEESDEDDE